MRSVIVDYLKKEMQSDDQIVVLDADLAKSNGTFLLHELFPSRAIGVGIAEANMLSVAAGLAAYGFKPFLFSFCSFMSRRVADQVAISVAYNRLNVKMIGSDPGITAQLNGGTHMGLEDVAIMRSIPNILIFEPADVVQYEMALAQIMKYEGPIYIRQLRKVPTKIIFDPKTYQFDLLRADIIKRGTDLTLIAAGIEVEQAWHAAEILQSMDISAEVISVHTIKPLDEETILRSVKKTGCAVVCENHNVIGGLGSAVAELAGRQYPVPLEFIGVRNRFGEVGKMDYLIKKLAMDSEHIVKAAVNLVKRKQKNETRKNP